MIRIPSSLLNRKAELASKITTARTLMWQGSLFESSLMLRALANEIDELDSSRKSNGKDASEDKRI